VAVTAATSKDFVFVVLVESYFFVLPELVEGVTWNGWEIVKLSVDQERHDVYDEGGGGCL
jgi:hypothetical protein